MSGCVFRTKIERSEKRFRVPECTEPLTSRRRNLFLGFNDFPFRKSIATSIRFQMSCTELENVRPEGTGIVSIVFRPLNSHIGPKNMSRKCFLPIFSEFSYHNGVNLRVFFLTKYVEPSSVCNYTGSEFDGELESGFPFDSAQAENPKIGSFFRSMTQLNRGG